MSCICMFSERSDGHGWAITQHGTKKAPFEGVVDLCGGGGDRRGCGVPLLHLRQPQAAWCCPSGGAFFLKIHQK